MVKKLFLNLTLKQKKITFLTVFNIYLLKTASASFLIPLKRKGHKDNR